MAANNPTRGGAVQPTRTNPGPCPRCGGKLEFRQTVEKREKGNVHFFRCEGCGHIDTVTPGENDRSGHAGSGKSAVHSPKVTYRKYATRIQHIADALVAVGCVALDKQAKALGVHRSTAWTIMRTKHKLDRLSLKTTNRMLASPELPPSVRIIVLQYLAERSDGLHSAA